MALAPNETLGPMPGILSRALYEFWMENDFLLWYIREVMSWIEGSISGSVLVI